MKQNGWASRRSFLKKLTAVSLGSVTAGVWAKGAAAFHSGTGGGAFVPVMLTPFKADLTIDFDTLSRLTDFYQAAGAKGFFANCLSSEMYHLTDPEKIAVTNQVVQRVRGGAPVVATGSFGQSLEEKAAFTKKIHATGVDAVILISSHFVNKEEKDSVFIRNLEDFLNRTGSIPLGTYECPSPYKRIISPEVYSYILKTGRFVYHKDTSESMGEIAAKLKLSKNTLLKLYNAHSGTAVESLKAGGAGMSPISGNFYPEVITWICENSTNPERQEDVAWIQAEIARTEPIISTVYPISAKYFLQKRGLPIRMTCRSSKKALTEAHKVALDEVYREFLDWCTRLKIAPVNFSSVR